MRNYSVSDYIFIAENGDTKHSSANTLLQHLDILYTEDDMFALDVTDLVENRFVPGWRRGRYFTAIKILRGLGYVRMIVPPRLGPSGRYAAIYKLGKPSTNSGGNQLH